MPRKRKGSGGGSIALYALLFVIALLAQIPKQVWIAIGVVLGIGVLIWAVRRATRAKPYVPEDDFSVEIAAVSRHATSPSVTVQFSTSTREPDFHTVDRKSVV